MYKIGIIGATGYTGSELVRLLLKHPDVEIGTITSETHAGKLFSDIHPQFKGLCDFELSSADSIDEKALDLVFLALPHGVSMTYVKQLAGKNIKVIDLSGDYRLDGKSTYEKWYQKEHIYPEGFAQAVYGLPELYRDKIRETVLVANPGCFPTGAILACLPLLKARLVDPSSIFIDSKTGVSGAGIKASATTHFANVNDNFKAYGISTHRHTIEIQQIVSAYSDLVTTIQFTPHLLPVDRGIFTSVYSSPVKMVTASELHQLYADFYANEYFVRLLDSSPEIKNIRGTNLVDIYPVFDERTGHIMVFSAMDNLVKGASGQAIQNMNIMLGLDEKAALDLIPLNP